MKMCKKCIALLLAVVLCAFATATVFAEVDNFINADWDKEYVDGDVNGDGNVTSDDIILIRKYIAGLVPNSDIDFDAADVTGDDLVNSDDLVMLRKMVAGLI